MKGKSVFYFPVHQQYASSLLIVNELCRYTAQKLCKGVYR